MTLTTQSQPSITSSVSLVFLIFIIALIIWETKLAILIHPLLIFNYGTIWVPYWWSFLSNTSLKTLWCGWESLLVGLSWKDLLILCESWPVRCLIFISFSSGALLDGLDRSLTAPLVGLWGRQRRYRRFDPQSLGLGGGFCAQTSQCKFAYRRSPVQPMQRNHDHRGVRRIWRRTRKMAAERSMEAWEDTAGRDGEGEFCRLIPSSEWKS